MSRFEPFFTDPSSLPWEPVRAELAQGVTGQVLLSGPVRAVRTHVAAGGGFPLHTDAYGHLFYILSGTIRVRVGDEERELGAGAVVRVPSGIPHSYVNVGEDRLELLSFNLPPDST